MAARPPTAQTALTNRQSTRYRTFDYATPGAYFFTIVTQNRISMLGEIAGEEMRLSAAGREVLSTWLGLPTRFSNLELDEFVIMPNHVHGILWFIEDPRGVGAGFTLPESSDRLRKGTSLTPSASTLRLGDVIGAFKSLSARSVNRALGRTGPLWQRNYHERIVRNDMEVRAIPQYIMDNPAAWADDRENPDPPISHT